jgi:transcriptional regulator with XRE-family HTH domain
MISPTALYKARVLAGLSQRELAKRVGLNYQVIRRAELGRPTPSITLKELGKLADKLGISPAALLQTHTPPPRPDTYDAEELTVAEARLLRGLQTGRRSSRSLSRVERELTLPRLQRENLLPRSEQIDDRH